MKVGFVGLGKLGLPCALTLEAAGHDVVGYDISDSVAFILQTKKLPYKEEGAQELLSKSSIKMVDVGEIVRHSEVIFVAVQTPHDKEYEGITPRPREPKDFDYSYLKEAVAEISANCLVQKKTVELAVISTVLPGTIARDIRPLLNEYTKFHYNPFFIAMGTTIRDFKEPEFVLIGGDNKPTALLELYSSFIQQPRFALVTVEEAELIKVSYNTFIGIKIAFANTLMEVCHRGQNMDVDNVTNVLKMATRRLISPAYLSAGMGDGGGCHPRDNIAMSYLANKLGIRHNIFEDIMCAREEQTNFLVDLIVKEWKETGLPVVILGKAFKPETNLTVGSPSILLSNMLPMPCTMHDPNIDSTDVTFEPSIFFIGTKHAVFENLRFPSGSVVIDPFRYLDGKKVAEGGSVYVPVGKS